MKKTNSMGISKTKPQRTSSRLVAVKDGVYSYKLNHRIVRIDTAKIFNTASKIMQDGK